LLDARLVLDQHVSIGDGVDPIEELRSVGTELIHSASKMSSACWILTSPVTTMKNSSGSR
jgi:hypothetical protein